MATKETFLNFGPISILLHNRDLAAEESFEIPAESIFQEKTKTLMYNRVEGLVWHIGSVFVVECRSSIGWRGRIPIILHRVTI